MTALRTPVVLFIACAVVGVLAALGKFTSMMGFPWVFGGVCLVLGSISLLENPQEAIGLRAALVVAAAGLALAGGYAQNRLVQKRMADTQAEASAALVGTPAPPLTTLEPLGTDPEVLERAASYSHPATIVTFWARWCSPCWKELPELDEFYRRNREAGFAVVALTSYENPTSQEERSEQFAKAEEFVRDYALSFPTAITDDDSIYRGYMVRSLPSAALVDGEGEIVAYGVGVEGGRELMRQARDLLPDAR